MYGIHGHYVIPTHISDYLKKSRGNVIISWKRLIEITSVNTSLRNSLSIDLYIARESQKKEPIDCRKLLLELKIKRSIKVGG